MNLRQNLYRESFSRYLYLGISTSILERSILGVVVVVLLLLSAVSGPGVSQEARYLYMLLPNPPKKRNSTAPSKFPNEVWLSFTLWL